MRERDRSAAQLLTQFGGAPSAPRPRPTVTANLRREGRVNRVRAPRRGRALPGRGWSAAEAPLATYLAATHEIGGLFPLLAANQNPAMGARIGYDTLSGGAFHCSPIDWVLAGLVTNPNLVVFGEPGRGKSSTVVALLLRMMLFGTRTLISGDVKGEYSPLVRALGIEPIALGRGSPARLNALDLGPITTRWDSWSVARQRDELDGVLGRWTKLLTALAEAQGYAATVSDEAVLSHVLRRLVGAEDGYTGLRQVTVPAVHHALAHPDRALIDRARFADERQFLDTLRPITDALGNLISGPLAGLFDEPTNFALDWAAPIQSMDLSQLRSRGDQAVAVALTVLGSWSSLITDLQEDGEIRIVVRDEVWRQMRLGVKAVQAVDSDLRLSRTERKIQILVGHKPSDFLSVGNTGSQEVAIAQDLLALCSTRILFGQSTRVADDLAEDLGLGEPEQDVTTGWCMERQGRALWKLENQPGFKIQTVLSGVEKAVFDTNAQLRVKGG